MREDKLKLVIISRRLLRSVNFTIPQNIDNGRNYKAIMTGLQTVMRKYEI